MKLTQFQAVGVAITLGNAADIGALAHLRIAQGPGCCVLHVVHNLDGTVSVFEGDAVGNRNPYKGYEIHASIATFRTAYRV